MSLTRVSTPQGFSVQDPLVSSQESESVVSIGGFNPGDKVVKSVTASDPLSSTGGQTPNISYNGDTITMNVTAFLQGSAAGWALGTDPGFPAIAMFQPVAPNTTCAIVCFPSGSSTLATLTLGNSSDLTNHGQGRIGMTATALQFLCGKVGTGNAPTSVQIGEDGTSAVLGVFNFTFANVVKFHIDNGAVTTVPVASTALPAGVAGMRASVTDATTPVVGSPLVGGGAVFANVHWSPTTTQWIVDGV